MKKRKGHKFEKGVWGLNGFFVLALLLSYLSKFVSPQQFWPLAFMGFFFPYLFLANLIFCFFWLIKKKKKSVLSLVVLVVGLPVLNTYIQYSPFSSEVPEKKSEKKLEILSYNVRLFDLYNWSENEESKNKIIDFLKSESADIMCFQEFYHTIKKDGLVSRDTIKKLPKINYFHDNYPHMVNQKHFLGIATFSRWPIVKRGSIIFNNDFNNICIYSDIKLPNDDTLRVYNAHLASIRFQKRDYDFFSLKWGDTTTMWKNGKRVINKLKEAFIKRVQQTKKITEHMQYSPHPFVFCGDINDTPVSYSYTLFRKQMKDAFVESGNGIGSTYIGNIPSFRIDYIMHSNALSSYGYETVNKKLSDHHPIKCNLLLK